MPQRRGLVPVKAVQQHPLSLSFFRDLLGRVFWCYGTKAVTLLLLFFVNVVSEVLGELYSLL